MLNTFTPDLSFRKAAAVCLTLVFTIFSFSLGKPSLAANTVFLQDEADIRQLTICYALGTDAIGAGDVDKGKALYRDCFTEDAPIAAFFPDGQGADRTGPDAWADFVHATFRQNQYTATQHLIGTITISIDPTTRTTASMTSYLHATHLLPNGTINVANGSYEDEAVKTAAGWRIQKRTLRLMTFLNLASPPASGK